MGKVKNWVYGNQAPASQAIDVDVDFEFDTAYSIGCFEPKHLPKGLEVSSGECSICKTSSNKLLNTHRCISCEIWNNRAEALNYGMQFVVVRGTCYYLGASRSPKARLGYGGRKFTLKSKTGVKMTTTNLECLGKVPQAFRQKMPDTANFV